METLPLFHRIAGARVMVLGDGDMADAKARLVEEAGGEVTRDMGEEGARLAFVVGEDAAEQAQALRARGLLVNVPDRPDLSDFLVPAIVDRAPVTVAIGSGGASAALSKALKERLDVLLPEGLGALALAIRQARQTVSANLPDLTARREFWASVLAPGAPLDPMRDHDDPAAAIVDALADPDVATASVHEVTVGPGGTEALTLADLRLMAQADLVIYAPGMPTSALALIRRDAARQVGEAVPEDAEGRIVLLKHAP